MNLPLIIFVIFALQWASSQPMPDEEPVAVLPSEDGHMVNYSFFPEVSGDFSIDTQDTGATIRGMFGITDYQGIFMYTSIIVAFLSVVAKAMGITIFPSLTASLAQLSQRLDLGVDWIKDGMKVAKKEIKGRGLPLDDETLDSITDVVYKALDAYASSEDDDHPWMSPHFIARKSRDGYYTMAPGLQVDKHKWRMDSTSLELLGASKIVRGFGQNLVHIGHGINGHIDFAREITDLRRIQIHFRGQTL
eukprot:maker-scaffold895_size84271-snap-gene-0.28 protein:Tk08201 transcript:maker-scaffold895_size84271-snap-gene-0.28-mRNA-1 annotation:"pol protein"